MKLLNNLTLTDIRGKIINKKEEKIKIIQKILNKKSIPKCQDKWNNVIFDWRSVRRPYMNVLNFIVYYHNIAK
jgi:esterase/lipase superfamily enzyme